MGWLARSRLRQLIVGVALLSTLVAVVNMFFASAKVQKQTLIHSTLEHNEGYASRLAQTLELALHDARQELLYGARRMTANWQEAQSVQHSLQELFGQSTLFNSMHVADNNGKVLAATDNIAGLTGQVLLNTMHEQQLHQRVSLVSEPFISQMNNLVVAITVPLLDSSGGQLGCLAGSIYLQHSNALHKLIGSHYQQDGSYLYIIDRHKRLIYHPEVERLNTQVLTNPILDDALSGETGSRAVVNSLGMEMLAGYAYIPSAGWGLVSQRPTKAVLAAHSGLMRETMLRSMPINFAMLVVIWYFSSLIAKPLRILAINARRLSRRETIDKVTGLNAWYYEVLELKTAFLLGLHNVHAKVDRLQHDVDIDPLTGLQNRRILGQVLDACLASGTPFSAITFDIDHFKQVNDTYGHAVGDQVLEALSGLVLQSSRAKDICIRLGGEEFLILMPEGSFDLAVKVAERLRLAVMEQEHPLVGRITVSLGVAAWPQDGSSPQQVLRVADTRLYRAKGLGRNQVCCESEML